MRLVGRARGAPERQLGDAVETADRVTLWGTALAGFAATVRRKPGTGECVLGRGYELRVSVVSRSGLRGCRRAQ
jgi:hypothetical protein